MKSQLKFWKWAQNGKNQTWQDVSYSRSVFRSAYKTWRKKVYQEAFEGSLTEVLSISMTECTRKVKHKTQNHLRKPLMGSSNVELKAQVQSHEQK